MPRADQRFLAMSREQAEAYAPRRNEILLSIRSHGAAAPTLSPDFRSVYSVECDDDAFRDWAEHDRMMSVEQAMEIVAWLERHRDARRILAHCDAGVSRSVTAITAFHLMLHENLPHDVVIPNPGMFARLMEGWGWYTRAAWSERRRERTTFPNLRNL